MDLALFNPDRQIFVPSKQDISKKTFFFEGLYFLFSRKLYLKKLNIKKTTMKTEHQSLLDQQNLAGSWFEYLKLPHLLILKLEFAVNIKIGRVMLTD